MNLNKEETRLPSNKDVSIAEKKEVWLKAWMTIAASSNITKPSTAEHWADECLKCYLMRFDK